MLTLFFNNDRNVGADVARRGFGRKQETRGRRDPNIDGSGHGLQFPQAAGAGVAFDIDRAGDSVDSQVGRDALHLDGTAGGGGFDTIACVLKVDGTGGRIELHVALDIGRGDIAGSVGNAQEAADIGYLDGAAGSGKLGVALDAVDVQIARSGGSFYGAANIINGHAA